MFSGALSRSFAAYQVRFNNWKIVKGDTVAVLSGKDRGKIGEILRVNRKTNQVLVSNVNIKLKKFRTTEADDEMQGVRPVVRPIHVSNVNLVDPDTGKPTKVRIAFLADGTKVRVSKRSGSLIPKPNRDKLTYENRHKAKVDGPLDTSAAKALEVTYLGEDFAAIKRDFLAHIAEKERVEALLVFDK